RAADALPGPRRLLPSEPPGTVVPQHRTHTGDPRRGDRRDPRHPRRRSGDPMSTMTIEARLGPAEGATALADFIRGRGAEVEAAARLPDDVADALRGSGLLRLLMPRVLGGAGGDWLGAFNAIEAVACADGSTGWTLMIGMTINMLTGYLDRNRAIELFSGSSPLFVAGVFEPRGIGRPDDRGE